MTVAPDGAGYLTRTGAPVTIQLHLTGQYTCAGCGVTEAAVTKAVSGSDDYDLDYTRACTNWSALTHAKTCTGPPKETPE